MMTDGATKTTPVQFIRLIRVMSSPFGLGGGETPLPTASPSHLILAPAALKASFELSFSQSLAVGSRQSVFVNDDRVVHLLDQPLAGEDSRLGEWPLLHADRTADVDLVLDHLDGVGVFLDGLVVRVARLLRDVTEDRSMPPGTECRNSMYLSLVNRN